MKECAHKIKDLSGIITSVYNFQKTNIYYSRELAGKLTRLLFRYGPVAEMIIGKDLLNQLMALNVDAGKRADVDGITTPNSNDNDAHDFHMAFCLEPSLQDTVVLVVSELERYSPVEIIDADNTTTADANALSPAMPAQESISLNIYGVWDQDVEVDAHSQEPIFTIRFFNSDTDQELGYLKLFGQPILCRSLKGHTHNIVAAGGIFQQQPLSDLTSIEDICRVLPHTLIDKVYLQAQSALEHGIRRGLSNAVGIAFKSQGTPDVVAKGISKFCDYGSYFVCRYYQHQQAEDDGYYGVLNAIYRAGYDTGSYFIFSEVVYSSVNLLRNLARCLTNKGWEKTGALMQGLSRYGHFVVPAYHALTQDTVSAVTNVVVSNAVQGGIEAATRSAFRAK